MNTEIKTAPRRGAKGSTPKFVSYDEIDDFVSGQPNMHFEGWDVIVLTKDPMGWSKRTGIQVNGTWHTKSRVTPNSSGKWVFREGQYGNSQ